VRALADAAAADPDLPLVVCATVLMRRLVRGQAPGQARVIHGTSAFLTPAFLTSSAGRAPAAGPVDLSAGLRAALRRDASGRPPAQPDDPGAPVDVTILLSQDGRLYAESTAASTDTPLACCWAQSFLRLLAAMARDPDAPLAGLPLVDDEDRRRILNDLNPYRRPDIRYRTMAGPFEEQVRRTPHAVALVDESGATVSYRELNERANRLAHFLRERGAGTGTRIGICLERGIPQIVAIYAAVKTGAAYIPLDADLPDQRLGFMLEDCAPAHLLTDPACRARIPDGSWTVHEVVSDGASWDAHPATDPVLDGTAAALLHILYTSGSTGRPKGVAYPTGGGLANLLWLQRRYPYHAGDATVFKTSPGFDVSIWEIFWPLYHGARLVICRPGAHKDPRHLADLVEEHGVSMIFLAPTVMTPFLDMVSGDRAGALRYALCGGEPVTARIRDNFHATLPGADLINCYGPTEAGSVTDMVLEPDPGAPAVPLGRPADNFRLLVLDENLDLVPIGMPGEAYLGGEIGVAYGYWRAPGRTAERFVPDPFGPPGSRLYRTGDLCRYREDGVLDHLGRIDRQIKIRGLRIEPGEIESVFGAHPAVADCAVVPHGDPVRLLAFVVLTEDRDAAEDVRLAAIRDHVVAALPGHMRPESVIPVPRIPANVNGKVDRDALIRVWQVGTDVDREIVPPGDELEASLVEMYGRLLGTSAVSVLDNFAELGGHSLLAFQLLDECRQELDAPPDVKDLLAGTVRDVATSIRAARSGEPAGPR
jgi:amino acid adenylation domain-containing protein